MQNIAQRIAMFCIFYTLWQKREQVLKHITIHIKARSILNNYDFICNCIRQKVIIYCIIITYKRGGKIVKMWIWIWLGVIVVSMVVETLTMEMVSVWFILGGLVALIMAGCGVSVVYQVVVAIAISFVCMFSLRKIALKLLKKDDQKTNMDRTLGQKTKLLQPITEDGYGTVKVNDVIYNAKTEDGSFVEAGKEVELLRLDGNKYIVKDIKK